jgi:hypothetical protein
MGTIKLEIHTIVRIAKITKPGPVAGPEVRVFIVHCIPVITSFNIHILAGIAERLVITLKATRSSLKTLTRSPIPSMLKNVLQ